MMFFARVVPGRKAEVFSLTGALIIQPRAWQFCSYRKGACAIGYTKDLALQAAWRQLDRPREAMA